MIDDTNPFEYIKKHHATKKVSILESFVPPKPTTQSRTSMRLMKRWMELAERAFILGVIHGHRKKLAERKVKQKQEKREQEKREAEMAEKFEQFEDSYKDFAFDSDESVAMIQDEDLIVF